jgi:DNA-binding MarR family transcriptional regulator
MPETRARSGPPQETPQGRLQEGPLRRLVGYQLAQAAVMTLSVFEEAAGKPHGLRTVEYTVLALIDANGEVAPAQLAQALNLSPSYITMALDKLEGKGLVKREVNPMDRRAQRLLTTGEGRRRVGMLTRALLEAERETFATLTEAEQWMLAELLHKLACSRSAA